MAELVSFQEIKDTVSMADILAKYRLLEGLRRQRNHELVGRCPFHEGKSKEPLHVSLTKNAFRCFAPHCDKKGNILDFVMFMEGTENIRQAALLIQGWFEITPQNHSEAPERAASPQERVSGRSEDRAAVNKPLTFELKNLDATHPYLGQRGLTKETIEFFGLGFCSRGLMKDRVAIPIHNERGELVAYAGRWAGEPPEEQEKYILPSGFLKSHVVFNLHRVGEIAQAGGLILVEGFFSCFWLHQVGFPNVVALMGSYLSERQRDLLVARVGRLGRIALLVSLVETDGNV